MAELKNITGCLLIDATASFLNGAGLGSGEDRNLVIPKTYREKVNGRDEEVPYVSAQSWRRWLRNTTNEESNWNPSELRSIDTSERGNTNKIATELNPIEFPEDDLFGYMKSGSSGEESIQRTSPFKSSILKGIRGKRRLNKDEAFVHLKEGTPLPYSTKFYSSHLEGYFNLEYSRLGVFENLGSRKELSEENVKKYKDILNEELISEKKFKKYKLKDAEKKRKERAAGLLKGLAFLRGGAKQAAFGSDVSPKVLVLAGMSSANPIFNNIFSGKGENPSIEIETLKEIITDYKDKFSSAVYIGLRKGYIENEEELINLSKEKISGIEIIIDSPIGVVNNFIEAKLK
ncbi:type I-B CRISPR-associated protein Cas7/Cst2/DevR [Cytophagaceae bacterium ABcell3]|nr:type I-B CRISPR-associated protein Cas7/Cst2/DevR [Cytophagaceae bacterium ABcell3]